MYLFLHTNILVLQVRSYICVKLQVRCTWIWTEIEPCFWWGRARVQNSDLRTPLEGSHINTCRLGPSPCRSLFCASVSALSSQLVLIDRVRFVWYSESVTAIDACPVWYPSVHQYGDNMRCVLTTYRMYQRQTVCLKGSVLCYYRQLMWSAACCAYHCLWVLPLSNTRGDGFSSVI
jgi:hypothetical protein